MNLDRFSDAVMLSDRRTKEQPFKIGKAPSNGIDALGLSRADTKLNCGAIYYGKAGGFKGEPNLTVTYRKGWVEIPFDTKVDPDSVDPVLKGAVEYVQAKSDVLKKHWEEGPYISNDSFFKA